jgi:DNA-directed RNA polymerase alpha subunit
MTEPNDRCEFCRYFEAVEERRNDTEGECQRYPDPVCKTSYDWCGEFSPSYGSSSTTSLVEVADRFGWSTRLRNCIFEPSAEHRAIETLGELCALTEEQLLVRRAFGTTSMREIRRTLDALGVALVGSAG